MYLNLLQLDNKDMMKVYRGNTATVVETSKRAFQNIKGITINSYQSLVNIERVG